METSPSKPDFNACKKFFNDLEAAYTAFLRVTNLHHNTDVLLKHLNDGMIEARKAPPTLLAMWLGEMDARNKLRVFVQNSRIGDKYPGLTAVLEPRELVRLIVFYELNFLDSYY